MGQSVCPGCKHVGGMMIRRNDQIWHGDCWIKHLEGALGVLKGYHDTGSPDEEDVIAMGKIVDDALAGTVVDTCPTGQRILKALDTAPMCERDLFIQLRPVDRVALHRLLGEMADGGQIARYEVGRLPGPVVEMYRLREMSDA